jgi:phthiocerol/phenolphthiocerol synthesis type-I polyketide synthase E
MVAVAHDRADAAAILAAAEHDNVSIGQCPDIVAGGDRVAFLFPGQGAQHIGMARGLYETEAVFRQHFDRCAEGFATELGIDLLAEVLDGEKLESTDLAQPALFAVEYGLAQLIMSYGVAPEALAGHSIGELVAATVAGIFDLPTAIKVVSMRARLMHAAPAGAMVAVAAGPDDIADHLTPEIDIAAINEPGSCVVAGPEDAIREFTNRLGDQGILARRVRTSHAFHSKSMDSVLPPFAEYLATLTLHPPRIPMLSNVTGTWMTDDEATDPNRWARHIRSTVRFADDLRVLLGSAHRVLVEVGPGPVGGQEVRQAGRRHGPGLGGLGLEVTQVRHPPWSPQCGVHRGNSTPARSVVTDNAEVPNPWRGANLRGTLHPASRTQRVDRCRNAT